MLTDRVFDSETVKLCFCQSAPDLWLVDLVGVIDTTIQRDDVLDENVDRHTMLLVLLVDEEGLLIQAVLGGNLRNLTDVVVFEFVDIVNDLALVRPDCRQHEEILEVLIIREWRWLEDDLLQQFNELNRQISRNESLDGHGDVIGVGALGQSSGDDLHREVRKDVGCN